MKKLLQKTKLIFVLIPLLYLTTTGAECEKLLTGEGSINQQLLGTWQMARMEGSLQDICYNERVQFQSNNVALLQCPGGNEISRNYSATSSILTYTTSGIEYDILNLSSTQVTLRGRNVNRTLYYTKISTSDNSQSSEQESMSNSNSKNSSDN